MIFLADQFSKSGPEWVSLEASADSPARDVIDLVNHRYSHLVGRVAKVYKVAGLEINSTNFLAEGDFGSLVIKLLGPKEYGLFQKQQLVYDHIESLSLPAPCVVGSGFDSVFIKNFHVAIEYVKGNYFGGSSRDLELASDAIIGLHEGFHEFQLENVPELEVFQDNSQSILSEFLKNTDDWESIFDRKVSALLENNMDLMVKAEVACRGNLAMLKGVKTAIFHMDLHPHNIIIGHESASIIDLDSLMVSRWPTAIGFCYFKLVRQVIAKQGIENVDFYVLKGFGEAIAERFTCKSNKLEFLLIGALTEVNRRLLSILQGNLNGNVSPWNSVLGIQLNALLEIKALGERLSLLSPYEQHK